MSKLKVTVIVPTTGNRGALLPYSVGSIQNQTVQDLEIFIIGDGITDETKQMIQKLKSEDSRIKFFDYPKHERRGEPYRHQALQEAKGEMVCYLCDRDLMLPDHVETLSHILEEYNFASTTYIDAKEDRTLSISQYIDYYGAASQNKKKLVYPGGISLSNVGHTLDLYHQLPFGWRTTPRGNFTDVYMWQQFLIHPACNAYSHHKPTILYFKRGHFPGASVSVREKDLEFWSKKITNQNDIEQIKTEAFRGLLLEKKLLKSFMVKMYRSKISIRGHTPSEVFEKVLQKVSNLLKKP